MVFVYRAAHVVAFDIGQNDADERCAAGRYQRQGVQAVDNHHVVAVVVVLRGILFDNVVHFPTPYVA